MIEKNVAIDMLQDIEKRLYMDDWKHQTLSTIKQYRKGLLVATDTKLRKLIDEYNQCEPESEKAKKLSEKADKILRAIYNDG